MPILNLTVDTEADTCEVTVDGVAIPNISAVYISNYGPSEDPEYTFEVTTSEMVGDVRKHTRLVGSETVEGKEATSRGVATASAFDGLVKIPGKSAVEAAIHQMYGV